MAELITILGVRKLEKIRNDEIRRRLVYTNTLVQLVYVRQHKWLGHVLRMDDERIAKINLQGKVDGIKRKERPMTAWTSAVEERKGISLSRAVELAKERERSGERFQQNVEIHIRLTRQGESRLLTRVFRQGEEEEEEEEEVLIIAIRIVWI